MSKAERVRPCVVCGQFYPGDRAELLKDVQGLLGAAGVQERAGIVRGLISPHAGYIYSGPTAASGYALLKGASYDVVVVISPSHREFFRGASVYPGTAYETPLGRVMLDEGLREELVGHCPWVSASEAGHGEEHAIEVQLPFLQVVLESFRLLPIVIGHQTQEICFGLAASLAQVLRGKSALLVASSDLSHYHPSHIADDLDAVMIRDVEGFDARVMMEDLDAGRTEACGGGPVATVLAALKTLGARRVEIVRHCNSGDVSGERTHVVGYLSAAIYADA